MKHTTANLTMGTFDSARETVEVLGETASQIKNAVCDAAAGAKHALDLCHVVRQYPWTSVSLAIAGGLMTALLPRPVTKSRTGTFQDLADVFRRELIGIAEVAIAAGASALKHNLVGNAPSVRCNGRYQGTNPNTGE